MCTRSSSNLVGESSSNPTTSNPKRRNRRCSKQPFSLEKSPLDTMADQRTMAELLRAPTEGYAEAIVVPPILAVHFELKHSLINMMTSDQLFELKKDNPHDHIHWFNKITSTIKYKDVPNSAIKLMLFPFSLAGGNPTTNLLNEISNFQQHFDKSFHGVWDRYKDLLRACPHHGFTELHQLDTFYNALNPADQDSLNSTAGGNKRTQDVLTIIENKSKPSTHAVNQQTSAVTTAMTAILKQFQATPPPAFVKAIEEICFTYGAAVNYNQGNFDYHPPSVANQIRPPGFAQPNVQNNQNWFSQSQGYNRGNNFNQDTSYQAPIQQNQVVPLSSGPLPSNTIANPKGKMKAITTRNGLVLDGPSVPMPSPFINPEEDERAEETLTDPELAGYTTKVPHLLVQKAKPPSQRNYMKMLKALLSNKEKLLELANTPLNENCSAVILKKLPEKLRDPGKFLIPCGFSEVKCKALADLGASINLIPLSVWKNLGLPELISTRMTLELANRAIYTSAGIARDVFVPVEMFTFPADFVMDYLEDLFVISHLSGNLTFSSHIDLTSPEVINPLSGNTTSSSPDHLLEEFTDELALITFPSRNDHLLFDIESDLKEIEYLLNHDPAKEMDSILEDSVDECNLVDPNNDLVDTIPEMFTDEHTLGYSSPPLYDDVDCNTLIFIYQRKGHLRGCSLGSKVIEMSDALSITTNGIQLTMVFNSPMLHLLRVEMVNNLPWMLSKNWLVQKQTALGKDTSNPFIVLAIPGQTATGVHTPRSDEDSLKLMELMVFWLQKDAYVAFGITAVHAAEGFEQIIDFLCASYIYYALTLNPHIYISCIKQFWNTTSIKRSGDVTRLQALVNKKKIVISEVVICEILQLDDTEGVVCLSNEEIFAGLAQMGYEKPSTKLTFYKAFFSSQKFNFSKYIFDSLVRNVDSSSKFYMYPRFIQLIIQNQVGDLSTHSTRYISPALTQKVFANMRRVRKGFSGVETPLFMGMLVAREVAEEELAEEQKLEIVKLKARVKRLEKANQGRMIPEDKGIELVKDADSADTKGRQADKQAKIYHIDLYHPSKVLCMQEDDSEVQKVVKVVTTAKLITDVVTAASQVSAASATISAAKPNIPAAAPTVVAAYTRRRNGVIIRNPKEELSSKTPAETPKLKDKGKGILIESPNPMKKKEQIELDAEYARKLHEEINKDHEEINKDINWDAAMDHVNQKSSNNSQYIKRYQGMKKRPQTESKARKNMMIYLNITAGYKMEFFKGMSYADICLIFQARFNENMRFLFKLREEMEEEDQEIIKRINETPAQKAAKRRKLNKEAQEDEELKKQLEIVNDEDDDAFTEATPVKPT
nr:hypothetical protein [Tanacetum cinerariifolium]